MIKRLRNKIVYDYGGISLKSIWHVLEHDVKELKVDIQNILNQEKDNIDV